jgi:hypothetical protein
MRMFWLAVSGFAAVVSAPAILGSPAALAAPSPAVSAPIRFQEIHTRTLCLRLIPVERICADRPFNSGSSLEVAVADLNHDRIPDFTVRYRSFIDCGSHGCKTEIYMGGRNGSSQRLNLYLVTTGEIVTCWSGSSPGIAFTGRDQHCFPVS